MDESKISLLGDSVREGVSAALLEDGAQSDLTASLVHENALAEATIISRQDAILCGTHWVNEVFSRFSNAIQIEWQASDGDPVPQNSVICRLVGNARNLLTGERTALNFLQTLSAVATHTREYVDAVSGTGARILDTRKTIPGLRLAQKYAVTCGGGFNHRIGLHDGILIKENHIESGGSIAAAVKNARKLECDLLEVEVENLLQLQEALDAGVGRILLDNFELARLREAVALNDGRAELEASGGVSLAAVRAIAETGVHYISVGALTKNISAVDLSMRFIPETR